MIPFAVIQYLDKLPLNYVLLGLRKYSLADLEEARQELLEFRIAGDNLRYGNCFKAIEKLIEESEVKVTNI